MDYQVIEVSAQDKVEGYLPRGAARQLWIGRDHEVIIHGPSETGKTRAALELLNAIAMKYDGAQLAVVRKRYSDMHGTILQTFEKKVLNETILGETGSGKPIIKFGGERVEFYNYWNGSRIWVGGLDKPGKVLSGERDFILANQCEELEDGDWQIMVTRVTGRSGNTPYTRLIGDANPGPCNRWMYDRRDKGLLTMLYSTHMDNPTLYTEDGKLTPQGKITMGVLHKLTGVYRTRLLDGKCGSPEGQVINYNPALHLRKPPNWWPVNPITGRQEPPPEWERIRVVDFGADKPFVCAWIAFDNDRRMWVYRYIYMSLRTVTSHAKTINHYSQDERILTTICDHDLEDRLTLEENGIPNEAAYKAIKFGIDKVNERMKPSEIDGLPRIFFIEDSLVEIDQRLVDKKQPYRGESEFDLYVWNKTKDMPVDVHNHFIDAIRYGVVWEDGNPFQWTR